MEFNRANSTPLSYPITTSLNPTLSFLKTGMLRLGSFTDNAPAT